ncbi:MAG: hypothetical protein GQ574_28230 [Crocinitomix sp.]|nr:hypothetical protein [Crocinitomix sp.]
MKKTALLLGLFLTSLFATSQSTNLECNVYGNPSDWEELAFTLYRVNGSLENGEYNGCTTEPAIMVAVIDPNDECLVWKTYFETDSIIHNPDHNFGDFNTNGGCRARTEGHFAFKQNDPVQLDSLNEMLTSKIPNAAHVLIYSWISLDSAAIADGFPELVTTFNDLGWTSFDLSLGNVPFALYAEIGSPGFAQEVYGDEADDFIVLDTDFECDLISFEDTVYTMAEDSLITEIDSVATGTSGLNKEINEFKFARSKNAILISGTGLETFRVQYICGLDGRQIQFEEERTSEQIKLFPTNTNATFLIVNLIGKDGSQIRKLIPFSIQ